MTQPQEEGIKEILEDLNKKYPEAIEFLLLYNEYIHSVDDIVDESNTGNCHSLVSRASSLASCCFSCAFWRSNSEKLLLVEQLINLSYHDSVVWEQSKVEWMKVDSKTLSHAGYNMFFAVLLLIYGYPKVVKISSNWRIRAHSMHLEGKPNVKSPYESI